MEKREIRNRIKELKSRLSEAEKSKSIDSVFKAIERLDVFKKAKNILLYNSLPDEIGTKRAIESWEKTKNVFLPRVNGNDIEILRYDRDNIFVGAFGIEEPAGNNIFDMKEIDLAIIPGIAFDKTGNRIGRGKGYYDRLLVGSDIVTIGIGYDCQLVDQIPVEPHDVSVDIVVTPSLLYTRNDKNKKYGNDTSSY